MFPVDGTFRRARRARRSDLPLDARYDGFVRLFRKHFGVEPLWIETDRRLADGRPALDIVLERTVDSDRFHLDRFRYDPKKQRAVAQLFLAEVSDVDRGAFFRFTKPWRKPSESDGLFVTFRDFERDAKLATHKDVTEREFKSFVASLDLGDDLWRVERGWGRPVVFVFTAQRAEQLAGTEGLRDRWADDYFAFAKSHDEFGYLRREEVEVAVDSKEILDAKYEGNLYYYFK